MGCQSNSTTEPIDNTTGNATLDNLNQKIKGDPNNHQLLAQRANLYYEGEAFDEALADINKALTIDSVNADYYHLQADIYLDYYKSFKALKAMEKAVSIHPTRIPTLLKLSEFQYILKQHGPSLQTIEKIFLHSPNNADGFYMLGRNLKEMGKGKKAIEAFQKCVENDSDYYDAYMELGLIYYHKEEPIALDYLNNALRIKPNDVSALYSKAMYYQKKYQDDKAIEIYKKISTIDPQNVNAYYNSAVLYFENDTLDKAYDMSNIAIKMEPTFAKGYLLRGLIQQKQGKKEAAISDFRQSLAFDPELEQAKMALKENGAAVE